MSEIHNVYNILRLKCPKCHQGNLFCNKNTYRYKGFFDMPGNCPKCNQDFQVEPGFYYGAMYSSYAITIIINAAVFLTLSTFLPYNLPLFLSIDMFILLVTMPYVFKVSRAIWLALMVKYDPQAIKNYEQKK